jgi:hypothetical protein
MGHQDPEVERLLRAQRVALGTDHDEKPIISGPATTNGKKWWWETWGKAVGSVLGVVMLAALVLLWTKTVALAAATLRVYETPARVDALEEWKKSLPSPQPPIPPDVLTDLKDFLDRNKKQEKRKP